MSAILCLLLVSVLCVGAQVSSPIPVTANSYAFARGDLSSPVTVDLWIDLGCSDCLNSWPLLTEVYETYRDTVKFNYRLMPLPYHQYAFMLAKSAFVVDTYGESGDVFSFFDTVYTSENQGRIYNGATNDLSYNDVMNDIVAEFVTNATNIDADQYIQGMDASVCGACEMNARYSFKNAALRGVYGTPMQQVNGVLVDGLDEMEDWKQVLDSLVN